MLKNISAFLLGAFLVLALAPFNFVICAFISCSLFLTLAAKSTNAKSAFNLGFFFGFGYFSFGLYWLYNAFITLYTGQINFLLFNLFSLLCLTLFFAFLSLYWGLASLLSYYFSHNIYQAHISFAICLGLAEYLRGHLFTGFPWNLIAYCATSTIIALQSSKILSLYIVSPLAYFIFASPAILISQSINKKMLAYLLVPSALLIADIMYGYSQIQAKSPIEQKPQTYKIALIQPNIPQKEKLNENYKIKNFFKLIELIKKTNKKDIKLIICPETSIDFLLSYNKQALSYISHNLYPGQLLLLGAPRLGKNDHIYNSALLLDSAGKTINFSDKLHLVPFGEYWPFKIRPAFLDLGPDYSAAKARHSVTLNKELTYLPLICYEAIFPDGLKYKGKKPNVIINITNDAWYGYSAGPFQHLQQTRLRAIEQQLYLIRVANNGISAIINPQGQIVKALKLNQTGSLIFELPLS